MLSSDHPLWDSPHRLFFLLAALWAMLAMGLWLLQLLGIDGLNSIPGGPLLWHAHELLFGFAVSPWSVFTHRRTGIYPHRPDRQSLAATAGLVLGGWPGKAGC